MPGRSVKHLSSAVGETLKTAKYCEGRSPALTHEKQVGPPFAGYKSSLWTIEERAFLLGSHF
jgi:hypothetical protein